jgi:hypothetical protein
MTRALGAFIRFWIDFIIGDDWSIAAVIALGLVAGWALSAAGVPAWWPLPILVVAVSLISLRRAITRGG